MVIFSTFQGVYFRWEHQMFSFLVKKADNVLVDIFFWTSNKLHFKFKNQVKRQDKWN